MSKFEDIRWHHLNWWGRLVIRFHNIVPGPEWGLCPAERNTIIKRGLKAEFKGQFQ